MGSMATRHKGSHGLAGPGAKETGVNPIWPTYALHGQYEWIREVVTAFR